MTTLPMATLRQRLLRDPAVRRMSIFLVVSIISHVVLISVTGRTSQPRVITPLILHGQLVEVTRDVRAGLVVKGETSSIYLSTPSPDTQIAEIQSAISLHPVDTQRIVNLPADIYYASNEVDVRAEPLDEVNLVYPVIPYQQRIGGTVTLNIFVNERGGIDKTIVVESIPPGIFDEAALHAVAELTFSPAIKNGKPVKNRKTIAVNFDPYENISTP